MKDKQPEIQGPQPENKPELPVDSPVSLSSLPAATNRVRGGVARVLVTSAEDPKKTAERLKVIKQIEGELEEIVSTTKKDNEKALIALQTQLSVVRSIRKGKATLAAYQGIRALTHLTIDQQKILAEHVLANSGVSIDEVIVPRVTVGEPRVIPDELRKRLKKAPQEKLVDKDTLKLLISYANNRLESARPLDEIWRLTYAQFAEDAPEKILLMELHQDLVALRHTALSERELGLIFRNTLEYLREYISVLRTGGFKGAETLSVHDIFTLLRENQRKLAHQAIVNAHSITGSDHGTLHILEADMQIAMKLAKTLVDEGKMTRKQRVLLRQAIIDHDMGYTLETLKQYGVEGAPLSLSEGYGEMTKDHPLYSAIRFEAHKDEMKRYFGEKGYETLYKAVLDHSVVTPSIGGGNIVHDLISRADCLVVSADLKSSPFFLDPEAMAILEQFHDLFTQESPPDGTSFSPETMERMRRLKVNLLHMIDTTYGETPIGEAHREAVTKNFDPDNPAATIKMVRKNFRTHCLAFDDAKINKKGSLVSSFFITDAYYQAGKIFKHEDKKKNKKEMRYRIDAVVKVLNDFGYPEDKIKTEELAARFDTLVPGAMVDTDMLLIEEIIGPAEGGAKGKFEFRRSEQATENSARLSAVLKRGRAVREALNMMREPNLQDSTVLLAIGTLQEHFDASYMLDGQSAPQVLRRIAMHAMEGEVGKAQELFERLRFEGHGTLQRIPNMMRKAA